jgi:hypothetical protein
MIIVVGGYDEKSLAALMKATAEYSGFTIACSTVPDNEPTQTNHLLMDDTFESYTLRPTVRDFEMYVDESLNASSLRRLKELMFVPQKLQLKPIYNRKPLNRNIRNNLPQRIRLNENKEIC